MTKPSATPYDIAMDEGIVRITTLSDGRLILAELVGGSVTRNGLLTYLGQVGITYGIIDHGIDLLAQGHAGEIPIARAEVIETPATITYQGFDLPIVEDAANTGKFERLNEVQLSFPVKAGQSLLEIGEPHKTIIRYPDGKQKVVHIHDRIDPKLFAGEHTSIDQANGKVISDLDGIAHLDAYGTVVVHETERAFGIGSAHGKIWKDKAFIVEHDVGDGSQIETASTLIVQGAVHGAQIKAGGNIQISFAVDNPTRNREAGVQAGQSLRCRALDSIPVWTGSYIIVEHGITRCEIECMDTVIARSVSASKVRVGNRLIIHDVKGYSVIHLGAKYVRDPGLQSRQTVRNQHVKRLHDLEQSLAQHRFTYQRTRDNLARQIDRMRDPAFATSQRRSARQVLLRLFTTLDDTLGAYKRDFEEFVSSKEILAKERVGLEYYREHLAGFVTPHILVFGTMDSGTQIQGPHDKLTLRKPQSNVRIGPDPYTGRLVITGLDDVVKK
ncbi:MAG: DUF342 domain-containing protein [Fidelibacterota bacterium]|nr:MAG: DUF342 domain-containing protein [Candidatus Neomarinimicrobiota bacterium]